MSSNDEKPSTSQCSPPSSKKIKTENGEEGDPLAIDFQTEVKQEMLSEEVFVKEEVDAETEPAKPSTSTMATQTDTGADFQERKANEVVEKLLAQLKPKKKVVRGPTVTVRENHVFQFLITLIRGKGLPKIWRRFKVPANYTFRQFHIAIQRAMGWKSVEYDYHLHAFKVLNPVTGYVDQIMMTDDLPLYEEAKDENATKIMDYFTIKNHKGRYEYDFGCGWQHEFIFENSFPAVAGETYPVCVEGAKACPPEDGYVHSDEDYDSDEFQADTCF